MRLFTEKISEQILLCYVLNIVNNCKNVFFFSCSFYFLLFIVCPSEYRRNFDILSKRQNTKVSFTFQLGLGRIRLAAFVFIYLCIVRVFLTDTK